MTPDEWAKIDRIHQAALERGERERAAYLDEACAGDASLRREVESLLAYATAAEAFLDQPALQNAAAEFETTEPIKADVPPSVPGYSVLQVLGAGGMGVVYLAEQDPPLRRRVALKLIRPGLDSKSALARFEAERRALALMDHPNIAAVFGTGVAADGRPFVAMEFVEGVPITEYCDRAQLSTRARLDLFALVCAGVQHAHQKGVIHRDIKPSNVLVAEQDGRPVPKVIDFGTATLADRPQAGRMGLTEAGTVVGTLEYMSPEQAALSTDIDTASDVYSLGVLLYELLVGDLPFNRDSLRVAGYDEMRRVIQETDPPKPSERLRGGAGLAGDLDWIVLRALEKDRRRRYSTVAAFATDIERFLTDQPIDARPPSAAYRVGKFARRHRGAVSAAAALILVLVAGFLTSTALYFRAERARAEADRQRADADDQRALASAQRGAALTAAAEATEGRNAAIAANAESDRLRLLATAQVTTITGALREAEYRTYVATINAADGLLRANAPNDAKKRLLAVPEPQRRWEWHHLFLRADSSLATLQSSESCASPFHEITTPFTASDNVLVLGGQGTQMFLRRCGTLEVWGLPSFVHSTRREPATTSVLAINAAGQMLAIDQPRLPEGKAPIGPFLLNLSEVSTAPSQPFGPFDTLTRCADISADGLRVVVGLAPLRTTTGEPINDVFEIWNVHPRRLIARVTPTKPALYDTRRSSTNLSASCMVRFSPDGSLVATSGATVHVWRSESGAAIAADAIQAGWTSQPVAFSPDAGRLAVGRSSGLVDVLDLTGAGKPPIHLDGNGFVTVLPLPDGQRRTLVPARKAAEVLSLAFAPDGAHIVSGTNRSVGIWDMATARLVSVRDGHDAEVIGVQVSHDGSRIFSADTAGKVLVWAWSAEPSAGVTRLPGASTISSDVGLVVSADGTAVASASTDGALFVWRSGDARRLDLRIGNPGVFRYVPRLAISSDGRYLFSAEPDGVVRKWTLGTQESLPMPVLTDVQATCDPSGVVARSGLEFVGRMALSPNGRVLAYRKESQIRCVVVQELDTLRRLATLRLEENELFIERQSAFAFRPDGVIVVASYVQLRETRSSPAEPPPVRPRHATVRLWDWRNNRTLAAVQAPQTATDVESGNWRLVVSADGSRIAMVNRRLGMVSIWDGNLSREVGRLPTHDLADVALSSDGRRIVTANTDSAVRVWDGERFQLLLTLADIEGHQGVAFTRDGRIIAGRASGGLTIWESKPPGARRE